MRKSHANIAEIYHMVCMQVEAFSRKMMIKVITCDLFPGVVDVINVTLTRVMTHV